MPEGHTLRRLANDLSAAFAGGPVRVSSPQGRFAADAASVDGQPVLGVVSAGKHLFIEFPGDRFIHVHLGLIGKFDVLSGPAEPPVGQVRLRLQNERAYADLRGATACELVTAEHRAAVLLRLGPDPLDPAADPGRAWDRIRRSRLPVGALLLDQAVFAGVGNVYRAEVLFRHRIHPLRPGRTLRVGQFRAIWQDLVELMHEGVRTGAIDTVRPEHTPEAMGRPARVDQHGGEVYVYRRTGQPCLVCGTKVRTQVLMGRNLFWCPRCQPTFRSRAVG
jgi:endonuclease-8